MAHMAPVASARAANSPPVSSRSRAKAAKASRRRAWKAGSSRVRRAKTGTIIHVGVAHNQDQAAALLSQDPNIENVAANNGFIEVSLKTGVSDWSFVPQRLVQAGYKLTLLKEEEVNLETAFMRLTKGKQQ